MVAFVINPAGYVELPTISVLQRASHEEFEQAICSYLSRVRFSFGPQQPSRVLEVAPFQFTIAGGDNMPIPDVTSIINSLRAMPPNELTAHLERLPHCA